MYSLRLYALIEKANREWSRILFYDGFHDFIFELLHLNKQHVATISLVEHTKDLATSVLAASFLMVHDTSRGGQDNITELTGRKQVGGPLLKIGKLDVETGGDDTALVDTTDELNNNLAGTVIVDLLELANVA